MSSPAASAAASPRQHPHRSTPRPAPAGTRNLAPYPAGHSRHQTPLSGTVSPSTGSATQTATSASPRSPSPEPLVLRLRAADTTAADHPVRPQGRRRTITWADDVIDNEGLGRKSSKVCCIYHRAREVGESSDESDSSDSSSDSDSDASQSPDDGGARKVGGGHKHGKGCGHSHCSKRKPSPNAYERMPKYMKERSAEGRS